MKKILIVEDMPQIRDMIERVLKMRQFDLYVAENGEEGVECAERIKPDIILMDIMMPGRLNGLEAARILKKQDSTKEIPIIFLTSRIEKGSLVEGFKAGAVDYITKPIFFDELLARISAHIKIKDQQEEIQKKNKILDRELRMAEAFQRSLIPCEFPQSSGVKWAARFQPALHIAGDFYDFIDLGGGLVAIVAADVAGHGVCSAMIAAMLKMDFTTFSSRSRTPAEILRIVNKHLQEMVRDEEFSTAFYGILDTGAGALSYSSAGHPPPLLYRHRTRELITLFLRGLPLGIFSDAEYAEGRILVEKNDKLLLYTDGIIEARNRNGEFYTEERLVDTFQKNIDLPVEEIDRAIYGDLMNFIGDTPFQDDFTLVILEL